MDKKAFVRMYNFAQKNKAVGFLSAVVADFSSAIFSIIYVALLAALFFSKNEKIYFCIYVPMVALFISLLLRRIIKKARPHKAIPEIPLREKTSYSFPSNHSVSAFIIALTCLYVNVFVGVAAIFLATVTGISRIFAGLHFPSDVLAGFLISLIIFLVSVIL